MDSNRRSRRGTGTSKEDEKLSFTQLSNLHVEFGLMEDSIDEVISAIKATAAKKSVYTYFVALHDHIRYVDNIDMVALHKDDGLSDWERMIIHKKWANIDFDFGTTCHNNFYLEAACKIKEAEERIGITKGASIELTMPFSKHSTNGPHVLVWFADFETAHLYQGEILEKRVYHYPAYAPDVSSKKIRKENNRLRMQMKAAVGMAHPVSGIRLPIVGVPPTGILDLVADGIYPLDYAFEYCKKMPTPLPASIQAQT
ncbi:MAG: hypothetical protein QXT25_04205 [Candidatus Anstonellaceae archaeon]